MKNKINIFEGRTKEWDSEKDKYRQYRSNQGRSPKKIEDTYKILGTVCIAFICIVILYGFINTVSNVLG